MMPWSWLQEYSGETQILSGFSSGEMIANQRRDIKVKIRIAFSD